MADLPKLGIVTLLNSMLESRDGDKISSIAEPITLDDLTRAGIIEACSQSQGQPCVCGALVKCTAAKDELETVHMIKKEGSGRAVKVAHIEQLNAADITRERPFSGCRLSADGKCTIEEEYIEGKAWQGVDRSVRNDPDMKFKQELLTEAVGLLPGADVKSNDVWHRKKQWTLDVNESYMICTHGYGLIYFADAGQSYVNAFLDEAEFMVVPNENEKECIILDNWLYLYYEPTVSGEGRTVERHPKAAVYDWGMAEDLSGQKGENWFAEESPVHDEIIQYGEFQVMVNSNNMYTDYEGRYWVAVGPMVMNPDYPREQVHYDIPADAMHYGTKIDIVVEDEEENRYYIPAVVGDAKEHSYPDGSFQTNVPFNVDRPQENKGNNNTNTIEFIGYGIPKKIYDDGELKSTINITNNYKLIEIIVYDGIYNYE